MADEAKPSWMNWLALTTVLFSTMAAVSSFKAGGYSTRAVKATIDASIATTEASNSWSYYQAKSIKQSVHEIALGNLERDLARAPAGSSEADSLKEKLAAEKAEISRYKEEKDDIMKKAKAKEDEIKAFNTARADNEKRGGPFNIAILYLQLAIMLSAIAALLKKWPLWAAGGVFGLVGAGYFAHGFGLFAWLLGL